MAIKRYNSATGKWEYVGNPGSITPNGIGAVSNAGGSLVVPANASTKGIQIQATASQSANLQEWQNSSGVAQTYIDPNGNLYNPNANYAGKNFIINGAQEIAQRGTSFTNPNGTYTLDRFKCTHSGNTGTLSQISSIGLSNFQYAARVQRTSGNAGTSVQYYGYASETNDVIPMQGKVMTLSFWARAGSNYSTSGNTLYYNLASGNGSTGGIQVFAGLTNEINHVAGTATLTTSWQRFSTTFTMRSDATEMRTYWYSTPTGTAGTNDYFDITGIQLELGSVATPFSRYGGTYQSEVAACQRYYYRNTSGSVNAMLTGLGIAYNNANCDIPVQLPVPMRIAPTSVEYSGISLTDDVNTFSSGTLNVISSAVNNQIAYTRYSTGTTSLTQFRPYFIQALSSATAYIGYSAEL